MRTTDVGVLMEDSLYQRLPYCRIGVVQRIAGQTD
jgi:hypothetical protein